jgi:hypothetical protein
MLDRGLGPRLSAGTLQLSIRCSSVHFPPRRSFPVSVRGEVAGSGIGWSGGDPFCAIADDAREIANKAANDPLDKNRMNGLANSSGVDGRELETG